MQITWNFTLVLLSILVAIIGCFTALTLAQRMRESTGRAALIWMLIGGITLGLAIWSMHFIGMLALHLPISLNYDLSLTLLSALPAIAAALLGFYVIREKIVSNLKIVIAGTLMGIGVSVMHYTGMAALKMFPSIIYDPFFYVLSIAIAITASWGALFIMILGEKASISPLLRFTLGSIIMGAAVSGMHYTGMQGMIIPLDSICGANTGIDPNILALMVTLISLFWFGGGNIAAFLDHRNAELHQKSLHELRGAHSALNASAKKLAKAMTEELRNSEAKTRAIIENALDCIITINSVGEIVEFNPAAERVFGYASANVIGQKFSNIIIPARNRGQHSTNISQYFSTKVTVPVSQLEFTAMRANGDELPVEMMLSSVQTSEDGEQLITGFLRDITERKKAEADIHSLAFYDPLTKLPNRRLLYDRLQHTVFSSTRHDQYAGILFIDLDNFKSLNDTRGHDIGDLLLIQAANRLIKTVRNDDTVARLGGDEFVIILEGLSKDLDQAVAQTHQMSEKIAQNLNQPYVLQGEKHFSSPSIGICLFRNKELSVDELLKRADTAMYQAKKSGRNTMRFFDPTMQADVEARHAIEHDLHQAINQQQFQLYYQPLINENLEIVAAEALIRWMHPVDGTIFPDEFISVAEETGLINTIGKWVLESACTQLKAWGRNTKTAKLIVAVNISARQFRQANFVEEVALILERTGASANKLKLELTETLILENVEDSIAKILNLQKIGIQFSMDDFGTGYSSLTYLKRLPMSQLKIEKSFIHDIDLDKDNEAIVQTIIGMAQSLQLELVAEGVEAKAQHQFLIANGCKLFQGFLYGKAMPIDRFNALINSGLDKSILK